jgi:hypothetical protein
MFGDEDGGTGCVGVVEAVGVDWTQSYGPDPDLCSEHTVVKEIECGRNPFGQYKSNARDILRLSIPGAKSMSITFDPRTKTESRYDRLQFFRENNNGLLSKDLSAALSGNAECWPGNGPPALIITGDDCWLKWETDGGTEYWGWKLTATATVKSDLTHCGVRVRWKNSNHCGVYRHGIGKLYDITKAALHGHTDAAPTWPLELRKDSVQIELRRAPTFYHPLPNSFAVIERATLKRSVPQNKKVLLEFYQRYSLAEADEITVDQHLEGYTLGELSTELRAKHGVAPVWLSESDSLDPRDDKFKLLDQFASDSAAMIEVSILPQYDVATMDTMDEKAHKQTIEQFYRVYADVPQGTDEAIVAYVNAASRKPQSLAALLSCKWSSLCSNPGAALQQWPELLQVHAFSTDAKSEEGTEEKEEEEQQEEKAEEKEEEAQKGTETPCFTESVDSYSRGINISADRTSASGTGFACLAGDPLTTESGVYQLQVQFGSNGDDYQSLGISDCTVPHNTDNGSTYMSNHRGNHGIVNQRVYRDGRAFGGNVGNQRAWDLRGMTVTMIVNMDTRVVTYRCDGKEDITLHDIPALVHPVCGIDGNDVRLLSQTRGTSEAKIDDSQDPSSLSKLEARFRMIQEFNTNIEQCLPFIDTTAPDQQSVAAKLFRACRGLVFQQLKMKIWEDALTKTSADVRDRFTLELDRKGAAVEQLNGNHGTEGNASVFGQAARKLSAMPLRKLRVNKIPIYYTKFVDEQGIDQGGLYRESFSVYGNELQSNALSLLVRCPNNLPDEVISGKVFNQDCWVPNPSATSGEDLALFRFLGKLMGMVLRGQGAELSEALLPLNFPAVIWKQIVKQDVAIADVFDVNQTLKTRCAHFKTYPEGCDIEDEDLCFAVPCSTEFALWNQLGEAPSGTVALVPGGQTKPVTNSNKEQYTALVEQYYLHEYDKQVRFC